MREAFRPYSKIVNITDGNAVEVTLHDSSGVALECNYVEVTVVSGNNTGTYFAVVPDITTHATYAGMPTASSVGNNAASGVAGIIADHNTGTATLSLNSPDFTTKIKISQSSTQPTNYAVVYGVVQLTNPNKDLIKTRGN